MGVFPAVFTSYINSLIRQLHFIFPQAQFNVLNWIDYFLIYCFYDCSSSYEWRGQRHKERDKILLLQNNMIFSIRIAGSAPRWHRHHFQSFLHVTDLGLSSSNSGNALPCHLWANLFTSTILSPKKIQACQTNISPSLWSRRTAWREEQKIANNHDKFVDYTAWQK